MKNQKNAKNGSRSRRKASRKPKGRVVSVDSESDAPSVQLLLPLADVLTEEEGERRAGKRGKHDLDRQARRWRSEDGYVVLGGKKVPVERPRVRGVDGKEVALERYERFHDDGHLQRAVGKHILADVATRDYGKVVDEVCDGYGIEKSSVSRHWKALSAKKLDEFLTRPLDGLDLAAVMIDGVGFDEYTLVVALGV